MTPEQQAARKAALGKLVRLAAAAGLIVVAIGALYWLFRDPFSFDVPSETPDLDTPKEAAESYARFFYEAEFLEQEIDIEQTAASLPFMEANLAYLTDNRKASAEKDFRRRRNQVEAFRNNRDALADVKIEFVKEENVDGTMNVQIKVTGKELKSEGEEGWKLTDVEPVTRPFSLTKIDGQWRVIK